MGGLAFSMSMVWAQAFPFVALQFYEEGDTISKEAITLILVGSYGAWLLLNIAFFCTIDLSYLGTFFGTKTAPQYTCEVFLEGTDDAQKFSTAFETKLHFMKAVNSEVREWIAANIDRWKDEKLSWFQVEIIPDDLLPKAVTGTVGEPL